jgi:hypothetical protein
MTEIGGVEKKLQFGFWASWKSSQSCRSKMTAWWCLMYSNPNNIPIMEKKQNKNNKNHIIPYHSHSCQVPTGSLEYPDMYRK